MKRYSLTYTYIKHINIHMKRYLFTDQEANVCVMYFDEIGGQGIDCPSRQVCRSLHVPTYSVYS